MIVRIMPSSSSRMTRHQWEVARQMYLSGMDPQAVADHFKIGKSTVQKRCYNKGWNYSTPQDKDENGLEVHLPIEKLKERYRDRMGRMIDRDAGVLEKKPVTTLRGLRDKYSASKDMHSIARDVFSINNDAPQTNNNFMIGFKNLYTSLFGEGEVKKIEGITSETVTIQDQTNAKVEEVLETDMIKLTTEQ